MNKVRLIFGARQTGKTWLLGRLLPEDSSVLFNLQDSRLRRRFEADPGSFSREVEALPASITHVGVDEIQKVPQLLEEVQFLYDREPERRQFFLTGSSSRNLRRHSANLLPGRCHIYHLYPTLRCEEEGYQGILGPHQEGKGGFSPRALEDRLRFGALPGVQTEPDQSAAATLGGYVENYLEEEVRREGLLRRVGPFVEFLRLAALESGMPTNRARLSQASGVPASTIRTYYQLLVDTFVGYEIEPYGPGGRKRVLRTPRFMFFDLGVRNVAAGLDPAAPFSDEAWGQLLEQWVGLELVQRAGYMGRSHRVSFWRTVAGAEVDYVWSVQEEDIPIEVKWTSRPRPTDARHVENFIDTYPERAKRGYVVCRAEERQQLTERVTAIPWQDL